MIRQSDLIPLAIRAIVPAGLAVLVVGGIPGCGGGDTTMDVQMAGSLRPDVDEQTAAQGPLSMPDADAFNYGSFRSGQTGAGRGESKAIGSAGAACRAGVEGDGTAWGEFQLGYAFDNAGDQPMHGVVKLRLKVTELNAVKGAAQEDEADVSSSKTSLVFFVKDSYGAVVKSENLLASSLAVGPREFRSVPELVFDLRFEPMRGYYLIVAGRAESSGAAGQQVSSAIEISDMAMQIEWPGEPSVATHAKEPFVAQSAAPAESADDSQP